MTLGKLHRLIIEAGGNDSTVIQSDSGWEGGETECDGVLHHKESNTVILKPCASDPIYERDTSLCWYNIDCWGGWHILTASDLIGRRIKVEGEIIGKQRPVAEFVFDGHIPTQEELLG